MAETAEAAREVADLPSPEGVERASAFVREQFVHAGESAEDVLAPGAARRRALDAALAEIEQGADAPSPHWRRRYSLLLGLERVLSMDEPTLVDGTVLNAHQVDALSGTLTALLAEAQRNREEAGAAAADEPMVDGALGDGTLGDELPPELTEGPDPDEETLDWAEVEPALDADVDQLPEQPEDPNAAKRFWFEHATGAGKTVAALGFVEASRTGGVLILTHRRNLVDQFHGELRDRGYADRICGPLLKGQDAANGPVTVETYQWFVRNAGRVSDAYAIVICDEAHTALGEKTSACIRAWTGPIFIGMTATGALIARHVADLFPTQTSRFDLAQAARRGVIAPLRCVRIPPGPGVRTIAKVPLRRGDVDVEFDQEMLAELLDQLPFNMAIADLYKTRFHGLPGVVYAAGVRHAYNVAQAFRDAGLKAQGVSGETPKRELARILADYERGEIDVLVNAQLLAEGWNSPRATVCMHLAPTASKRIYQQRVGRVTRRHPGKEAGIVVDFVHPATKHDDPVVTLHSLLDRDVYRGGAIVVGPVRRGRGRRLRVERRVLPVAADEERRHEVFERELWRIAVEHLDWGEQHMWAALAGARVLPNGWRRARAMLHFDQSGELKRRFLITAMQRNKNGQLRLRALQEVAAGKDPEAIDHAVEIVGTWPRDEKREGVKVLLGALADKRVGRRDQANNWIWRCAEYTREVHEEYAVQRWPETKRLLGLLVNSSGGAHARNARRLVHAARQQDRRLTAALLAAALAHTPEAGEVINGARMRLSRKPGALARELLRNFPKGKASRPRTRTRRRKRGEEAAVEAALAAAGASGVEELEALETALGADGAGPDAAGVQDEPKPGRRRRSRARRAAADAAAAETEGAEAADDAEEAPKPRAGRSRARRVAEDAPAEVAEGAAEGDEAPKPRARRSRKVVDEAPVEGLGDEPKPRARRSRKVVDEAPAEGVGDEPKPKARRSRKVVDEAPAEGVGDEPKPKAPRSRKVVDEAAAEGAGDEPKPKARRARAKQAADEASAQVAEDAPKAKPRRARARKTADEASAPVVAVPDEPGGPRGAQDSPEADAA